MLVVLPALLLALQLNPRLGPADVKRLLRATSFRDAHTGGVWNAHWGYGKLDLGAFLNEVARTVIT